MKSHKAYQVELMLQKSVVIPPSSMVSLSIQPQFELAFQYSMRQLQMFQKVESGGGPIFKVVLEF